MRGTKAKIWALVVSLMLPGFFTWSCSGTAARTIRDEAVQGAADAVEATIFDLVFDALTPPAEDDEDED
ncbi:MAG: hypothetical protein ACYTFA_13575 [Planctomycetota bacterium]|jgi:hypothetical protein